MNFQFSFFKESEDTCFEHLKSPMSVEGMFFNARNTVSSFILILILFLIFNNKVFAQQVDLAISPPLLETIIKPGKSIMIAYRLQNFGDPAILTARVLPIEPKDNLGNVSIRPEFEGPIRFSLDNADRELEKPFLIKTENSSQLLLRIRVPEGTPNGDYYYVLLAEAQPPPTVEGIGTARAKVSIGSNILITVTDSGTVEVKGKVTLFDVISRLKFNLFGNIIRLVDSTDKIPVVLIVDNSGRNMFKPEGKITLQGNFGEKAAYDIVPENILAQSQRLLTASPSAEINSTLVLSGFFVGRYRLSADIDFGENSPRIFASASFVALPFKFLLALLTTAAIGIFIIRRFKDGNE